MRKEATAWGREEVTKGFIQSRDTGLVFKSGGKEKGGPGEAVRCHWWRKTLWRVGKAEIGATAEGTQSGTKEKRNLLLSQRVKGGTSAGSVGEQAEPRLETQGSG